MPVGWEALGLHLSSLNLVQEEKDPTLVLCQAVKDMNY